MRGRRASSSSSSSPESEAPAADPEARRRQRREFKKARKERLLAHLHERGGSESVPTPAVASEHPFVADPGDHAETPFEAYRDIEPLLFRLVERLGRKGGKAALRIYDPFFCEGSVTKHLNRLGFTNVINRNEDFYDVLKRGAIPDHDVLVTNPPFSGDHMERTLRFALDNGKPFFLLLPQFVAKKAYYLETVKDLPGAAVPSGSAGVGSGAGAGAGAGAGEGAPGGASTFTPCRPFFLGPTERAYAFSAPGRDADGSKPLVPGRTFESSLGFHVFAGSFQCVWFACLGTEHTQPLLAWWRKKYEALANCAIADETQSLPQLAAIPKPDPAKRRWRKKLRRLHNQIARREGEGTARAPGQTRPGEGALAAAGAHGRGAKGAGRG
jgi:hypothetical protein